MDVGWGESLAWRQHHLPTDDVGDMYRTDVPLLRNPRLGNGILSVYVVNQLAVPDDTVDNDIEVNVFISATDNFEVAAPTSYTVGRLRLGNALVPHSEESNAPQAISANRQIAMTSEVTDGTTLVNFGECIPSFRQLLRRYNYSHIIPDISGGAQRILEFSQPAFPLYPGYRTGDILEGRVYSLASGRYVYGQMTQLQYLNCAYAARRGGIRYFVDASHLLNTTKNNAAGNMYISRLENTQNNSRNYSSLVRASFLSTASDPVGQAIRTSKYFGNGGLDGGQLQCLAVNPTMSVEIPYYNANKFEFAKSKTDAAASTTNETWFQTIISGSQGSLLNAIEFHVSTGEDFGLFFYLGPPIFYYEDLPPIL